MDNSIYLGDIDPNNEIISTINIRRTMLFHLLIWDSIVLSDSQYLTDPRIHIMMSGFSDKDICEKYSIPDVMHSQKGFEHLVKQGLVEVAHREIDNKSISFSQLWTQMVKKDTKDVPYLPQNQDYAEYLDSINHVKREYNLTSIGNRFKHNLNHGISNGGLVLSPNNDTDTELKKMFNEPLVLFRNILDFIQVQLKDGKITQQRYNEIYTYVYSCYSVNISAETGCLINTKLKDIPLHLESGVGDYTEHITHEQLESLRPTWALNPLVLDYISFESFAKMRKELQKGMHNKQIAKFCIGTVTQEEWKDFRDTWEDFTETLENRLKGCLYEASYKINNEYIKEFCKQPKYVQIPKQQVFIHCGIEIVKNIIPFPEPVRTVLRIADIGRPICNMVSCLSRKETTMSLIEQKQFVERFLDGNSKIITKYGNK